MDLIAPNEKMRSKLKVLLSKKLTLQSIQVLKNLS